MIKGFFCVFVEITIIDEKIAIMDTVDKNFAHEWLDNIQHTLGDRKPDYLIVQHMEPDHSANIAKFLDVYLKALVVSSAKAFVTAPFSIIERFGFQSGRAIDKFEGLEKLKSDNGVVFLSRYINSFMSLKVESYVDLDTHGMFICSVTEARVLSDKETMTYSYYHENVKPKPETEGKKGYVCKVCGWVYEGETLPEDIVCPLCKHGAVDFEEIV